MEFLESLRRHCFCRESSGGTTKHCLFTQAYGLSNPGCLSLNTCTVTSTWVTIGHVIEEFAPRSFYFLWHERFLHMEVAISKGNNHNLQYHICCATSCQETVVHIAWRPLNYLSNSSLGDKISKMGLQFLMWWPVCRPK